MQMISMAIDRLAEQIKFLNYGIIVIGVLYFTLTIYKMKKEKEK